MSNQHIVPEHSEEQHKTRERIIAATSKVLAKKGYAATTLREIAREAQLDQSWCIICLQRSRIVSV